MNHTDLWTAFIPDHIVCPIVVDIPHSGRTIPEEIQRTFRSPRPALTNMDWYLDQLYDFLPALGIPVLQANFSRYVVDLNRAIKEPLFGSYTQSVVYAETTFKTPLYDNPLTSAEIERRIDTYYQPYHQQLTAMLEATIQQFGKAYLLDLHSFFIQTTKDVCLGNHRHRTSSAAFMERCADAFHNQGFEVAQNEVLLGGYITQHYGEMKNVESLQIKIRYPTYLDQTEWGEEEPTEWDSPKFRDTQSRLRGVFCTLIDQF